MINLGYVTLLEGDYERATTLNEEAVAMFRDQGQRDYLTVALDNVDGRPFWAGTRSDPERSLRRASR